MFVWISSASIQAEKFSFYFNNCPILHIPGNIYPIKEYFLEDYITKLKYPYENETNSRRSIKEIDQTKLKNYISELELDLVKQHKSIDVFKKIQAIGTDFGSEINCDLIVSVIELICRISSQGINTNFERIFQKKMSERLRVNYKNIEEVSFCDRMEAMLIYREIRISRQGIFGLGLKLPR
jgi:hypothetical protein